MKTHQEILLLMVLLTSCSGRVNENPLFDPFEINYSVTEKGLLDNGYETMPEDVPLLAKQVGDTLIYYQLYDKCDSLTRECATNVVHRFCYIHLDTADSSTLQKLMSRYDADIISDFLHSNEINLDGSDVDSALHATFGFHGTFFVKHRYTKQIFECDIGGASGTIDDKMTGFELSIVTDFPWNWRANKREWMDL